MQWVIWVERTMVEAEASSGDWHDTVVAFVLPLFLPPALPRGIHGDGPHVPDGSVQ